MATAMATLKAPAVEFVNPRDFRGSYLPDFLLAMKDVPPGAKLVYVCLLRHYNLRQKAAWPSQETVGRETGLSARQVARHVQALKTLGLLDVRGTLTTNRYRFPWHKSMRGAQMKPAAITRDGEDEET